LLHSDDVTVEHCTIEDVAVAVGCTKNPGVAPDGSAVLANRNWRVLHNTIRTTSNKAIELGHCENGWIVGNDVQSCNAGPQAIFWSRNIWIMANIIRFVDSGINVTHGSNHIWIEDNDVEAMSTAASGAAAQPLLFRTEPKSGSFAIHDVRVARNRLANTQAHTARRAVQFQTRTEVTASVFERITFRDNDFDGVVFLRDATAPAKTTMRDFRFNGNRFSRAMDTVSQSTCLVERMRFSGNEFDLAQTVNASDWEFRDDVFTGGLTLSASSSRIRGSVQAPGASVTDSGTDNDGASLMRNLGARPSLAPEPVAERSFLRWGTAICTDVVDVNVASASWAVA
jgi:hypothetical protein